MHLLMCLFCQVKKAYFIDSNYSEFWNHGLKEVTLESIMRTSTRASPKAFGSRVVMDIKQSHNVENFMLCLYWWLLCRWSPNPECVICVICVMCVIYVICVMYVICVICMTCVIGDLCDLCDL
jgi:hypothetical protein